MAVPISPITDPNRAARAAVPRRAAPSAVREGEAFRALLDTGAPVSARPGALRSPAAATPAGIPVKASAPATTPETATPAKASVSTPATSAAAPAAPAKTGFYAVFDGTPGAHGTPSAPPPPAAPAASCAPTPESLFGRNPWVANPTGRAPNGVVYGYNPFYFATQATADKVAAMVGGRVVATNEFVNAASPFFQNQPNLMVELPDGRRINPGIVASFYTHGYPAEFVDTMVSNEVKNA